MTAIELFSDSRPAAVALIVLLGVAGMAVPPVATCLAVRFAHIAPSFAAGHAVAAFNGGIALGSWIAGDTLDSSLGPTGPAVVGVAMAVIGLVPLLLLLAAARATTPHRATAVATPHGAAAAVPV